VRWSKTKAKLKRQDKKKKKSLQPIQDSPIEVCDLFSFSFTTYSFIHHVLHISEKIHPGGCGGWPIGDDFIIDSAGWIPTALERPKLHGHVVSLYMG